MSNRHPADELAEVRERIRELSERERELVEALKLPDANLVGDEFVVFIKTTPRRSIAIETAERVLPKPLFDQVVSAGQVTRLTLRPRVKFSS